MSDIVSKHQPIGLEYFLNEINPELLKSTKASEKALQVAEGLDEIVEKAIEVIRLKHQGLKEVRDYVEKSVGGRI